MTRGSSPAAERANDVAPRPNRSRDEYEQTGEPVEGASNGAEGDPGDQVTKRRNCKRGKALTQRSCVGHQRRT